MQELKLVHKPLHCPVCGERFMNLFGQPLPNHAQLRCRTTSGDIMDIGVCANCIEDGVTQEMVEAVLNGIKDYWVASVEMDKNLKGDEKRVRKQFHLKHKIQNVEAIIQTGKDAERKIKKEERFKSFTQREAEAKDDIIKERKKRDKK